MVCAAVKEMVNAANMAFALCPLLSGGAIEALLTSGSGELKQRYLHKMVSGDWSGTMVLTSPYVTASGGYFCPSQNWNFAITGTHS